MSVQSGSSQVFLFLCVLQVRNLMLSTTDETLLREFSRFKPGCVERIKKLLDYAFIHYHCREDAEEALHLMNGALIDGATVEVMLAKPAGVKDRNSKRNSGRGYLRSGIPAGGGAVDRGLPVRSHVGSPVSSLAGGEDRKNVRHGVYTYIVQQRAIQHYSIHPATVIAHVRPINDCANN